MIPRLGREGIGLVLMAKDQLFGFFLFLFLFSSLEPVLIKCLFGCLYVNCTPQEALVDIVFFRLMILLAFHECGVVGLKSLPKISTLAFRF